MNDTLKQLKSIIQAIDSSQHIEESLTYGDYMLLCVDRLVVHEQAEAGELSDEELALVVDLDAHFKQHLTGAQLEELAKREVAMPIKQWWG